LIRQSEKYNPSRNRFRVDIQIQRSTRDEIGGYSIEWVRVLSRWADIVPISAGESFQSGQIVADTTHKIHMRVLSSAEMTFAASVLAGYNSVDPEHDAEVIASYVPLVYSALVTFTSNPPQLIEGIDPNASEPFGSPLNRLVYKGRIFHVTATRMLGNRSEWLEIFAREES
jgi:head-tail adaptor